MEYRLINTNFQNNYIENLLKERGGPPASHLLSPTIEDLQESDALDNIDTGARLLLKVLSLPDSQIALIVDPDVDGFTSAAIIYQYIYRIYPQANIHYFIHSGKQHGLEDMIDELEEKASDLDLIILPDSSSNDEVYHYRLRSIGIPVLVLDHHEANEYSSDAVVINNQLSVNYHNKQLTGAGVVYQFCRYLDSILYHDYADDYIDLACLGIISDMGKVNEPENAYIIKQGLNKKDKNYFFQCLLDKAAFSIGDKINSISIAFYVTPNINALIRVGTMKEKEDLFLAFINGHKIVPSTKRGEKGQMEDLATQVARNCTNAKNHQNKELDGMIERIDFRIKDEKLNENQLLVIELNDEEDLTPTLNGLLAMKCAAKYQRPTLVLRTNSEGIARGSARGVNDSKLSSLKDYLESTNLFEYCAGHANAFGNGIKQSLIPTLIQKANIDLLPYDFGTTYYNVNFERSGDSNDLSDLIRDIDKYNPIYGQGCDTPLIAIKDITINKKDINIIGKNSDTLRFEYNGITYIRFHAKELISKINNLPYNNLKMEIVGKANMNEWMGRYTPQIIIEDLNIYNDDLSF